MKKRVFFMCAVVAMLVACGDKEAKTAAIEGAEADVIMLPDSTECVKSGDVVYVDMDAMFKSSKIYLKEGKPLEERLQAYEKKAIEAQEDLAKREQGLVYEQNRLQQDGAKLQSDYQKGLITTLNAQTKSEELEKRARNIEASMAALQKSIQQEGEKLQQEEQQLAEESAVLQNRFTDLLQKAISEINADGRYKMIVNSMMVIDAADGLNISSLVLSKIDELYEAGALTESVAE
ncbi:MAG: OmpH family outer membrane protein [Alistipes sp.]|nr:OmpH family outer membrane protein [Alistipes sp.]